MSDDYDSAIAASLQRLNPLMSMKPNHVAAHVHSSSHRKEFMTSDVCGCFYCLESYSPTEIVDWIDEDVNVIGSDGFCAKCGSDSGIGSRSRYAITTYF